MHVYFYELSSYNYNFLYKIGIIDVSNREFFIFRDCHRHIGHIDVGDGSIYAIRRASDIDNKSYSYQAGKPVRVISNNDDI